MDIFWLNWLLLAGVFFLAVISPGPDFVVAVKNAIMGSRKIGVMTALGFAVGVCVHTGYTLIGLATIIAQSVLVFNLIKYVGAAYLLYMGIKALRSKGFEMVQDALGANPVLMTPLQAFYNGLLTNILNPKATLFFLAVFSQFITPETPMIVQVGYAATCAIICFLWFTAVSFVLTDWLIKQRFLRFSKTIDRLCGGFLIALSVKLALSKA